MINLYTIDNLLSLMQSVGTLRREQITRFFASELSESRVEYLINQLILRHILRYNEEENTITFIGAVERRKEVQSKIHEAFWVLVEAGSEKVKEIVVTVYPTQFLFIADTPDEELYDVTVVNSEHDALLAQRLRSETIPRGKSDIVTHIAVIPSKDDAGFLSGCGFDFYALIDPLTKKVKYYPLDGN